MHIFVKSSFAGFGEGWLLREYLGPLCIFLTKPHAWWSPLLLFYQRVKQLEDEMSLFPSVSQTGKAFCPPGTNMVVFLRMTRHGSEKHGGGRLGLAEAADPGGSPQTRDRASSLHWRLERRWHSSFLSSSQRRCGLVAFLGPCRMRAK